MKYTLYGITAKYTLFGIAAVALSACQTTRYVQIPCLGKNQVIPAEPEKVAGKLTGNAGEDIKTIAGSNVRLRAWGQGLRGILEGCRAR